MMYMGACSVSYKFTGKERDTETELDYFGARYYGSTVGQFLSPDIPLLDQHLGNPQSWNLYSYGRNNPLGILDPTGNAAMCAAEFSSCDNDDKVGIDPGHGDKNRRNKQVDPGAVDGDQYEKDYALSVANEVTAALRAQKVDVFQTRSGDITVDGAAVIWRGLPAPSTATVAPGSPGDG